MRRLATSFTSNSPEARLTHKHVLQWARCPRSSTIAGPLKRPRGSVVGNDLDQVITEGILLLDLFRGILLTHPRENSRACQAALGGTTLSCLRCKLLHMSSAMS